MKFLCVDSIAYEHVVKYLQSYNACALGSALVIYNDVEYKCALKIFANDSIAKIFKSQNNSVLQ